MKQPSSALDGSRETNALIAAIEQRLRSSEHDRRHPRHDPTESCFPECGRCFDQRTLCALTLLAATQAATPSLVQRPELAREVSRRFNWDRITESDFVRLYHCALGVSADTSTGGDRFTRDLAAQLFDDRSRMDSDTLVTRMEAEVEALVSTIALVKAAR